MRIGQRQLRLGHCDVDASDNRGAGRSNDGWPQWGAAGPSTSCGHVRESGDTGNAGSSAHTFVPSSNVAQARPASSGCFIAMRAGARAARPRTTLGVALFRHEGSAHSCRWPRSGRDGISGSVLLAPAQVDACARDAGGLERRRPGAGAALASPAGAVRASEPRERTIAGRTGGPQDWRLGPKRPESAGYQAYGQDAR